MTADDILEAWRDDLQRSRVLREKLLANGITYSKAVGFAHAARDVRHQPCRDEDCNGCAEGNGMHRAARRVEIEPGVFVDSEILECFNETTRRNSAIRNAPAICQCAACVAERESEVAEKLADVGSLGIAPEGLALRDVAPTVSEVESEIAA